ncbi:MAG TPA: PAS-domain containing protein, partial [Acetobacteraceae bacterium]
EERAVLAAANAQLQVARAYADAKAEQLEATLAGMTDGVAMVDAHLCLVEWNARFPEVAGIPSDALRVGLPMEEILRIQARTGQFGALPTDPDVEAEVGRRMGLLRTSRFGVTQRERPDGRVLELRRNRLPDGGFVTLYSDVTDHKRAENALKEARALAEAANHAKSRFVAIVSHEIRTPLNALLNTLRLLADSVMVPSQRSLLDMARQSGDALSGLINDILEMSHMEAGDLTLRPSLFSLRPLLEGAVEMFRSQAAERGIRLNARVMDGVPDECWTDPGRLRQVLLNLLSNATKFAAPGDVELIAGAGDTPACALRIEVRDTGPVIRAEDRARLFLPFSRLERPGTELAGGTGLGLAICRQLTGLMGGEIGCDAWMSATGTRGNAFWITLPPSVVPVGLAHTAALLTSIMRPARAPRCNIPRTRILLVEDIAANQIVTATLLRREGHMVDIASSGEDAVRAMRTCPYDIVFMDIFMPGMSGQEATQRIRGLPGPASRVPIIALTANVSQGDETLFREAGMDGILGKPVALAGLLHALARHAWAGHPANIAPETAAPPAGAPSADEAGQGAILSRQRIDELRHNLAPETFATLVEACLVDLDHRLPALRRALLTGAGGAIAAQA